MELFALLGTNGAGKTTTIEVLRACSTRPNTRSWRRWPTALALGMTALTFGGSESGKG